VVGGRVVVRMGWDEGWDAGSSWELGEGDGVGSRCAAALRSRRRLLQVDGESSVGAVLLRQVAVGACRSCFFAVFGPLVGGY
jgi:hypothetical protein